MYHSLAIPYQIFNTKACLKPLNPQTIDFYPWPPSFETWLRLCRGLLSLTAVGLLKLALLKPQFILVMFWEVKVKTSNKYVLTLLSFWLDTGDSMLTKCDNSSCNPGREKYVSQIIINIYILIMISVIWTSYKVVWEQIAK